MRKPVPDRKERRRSELLAVALDTFVSRGFAATRMEDIAARAGVSKGTVYLYFDSKQAVFEALVRSSLVVRLEEAERFLAQSNVTSADQLRSIMQMAEEIIADPAKVAIPKLVMTEAGNFPDLVRFYRHEVIGRALSIIAGILRQGIRSGEFRNVPVEETSRLFVAPFLMTALWQTVLAPAEDEHIAPGRILAGHADLFLRGIAAKEET